MRITNENAFGVTWYSNYTCSVQVSVGNFENTPRVIEFPKVMQSPYDGKRYKVNRCEAWGYTVHKKVHFRYPKGASIELEGLEEYTLEEY